MSILPAFRRDGEAKTTGMTRSCVESGFPICLSEGLLKVFGPAGKKVLDAALMNRNLQPRQITSQADIYDLYTKYVEQLANMIGESPTKVIEFESFKLMQDMSCTKCPLFELELSRKKTNNSP